MLRSTDDAKKMLPSSNMSAITLMQGSAEINWNLVVPSLYDLSILEGSMVMSN